MLYLELQQQKSAKNPENYRWDGFANVWKPEGRLDENHLHIVDLSWISASQWILQLGARLAWWRGDGRQNTVRMVIPCLSARLAGWPSTWLLHQYNNELDIEGLLSAGESWPLMPRFGHLYPATATDSATFFSSLLARPDRIGSVELLRIMRSPL